MFVYPAKGGKGGGGGKPPKDDPGPSAYCDDGGQDATVPQFADANPDGLTFNINENTVSGAHVGAIHSSFTGSTSWDPDGSHFTINDSGGAARPEADGNNSIGWLKIVLRSVLAATWSWGIEDADGKVTITETDIYFNAFQEWDAFAGCDAAGKFEVANVGTHEIGHTVGLDHLSDSGAYATMYPSASKGEVRKQTLTAGDQSGYAAAGAH